MAIYKKNNLVNNAVQWQWFSLLVSILIYSFIHHLKSLKRNYGAKITAENVNSCYISDIDHLRQFIFNNCLAFEPFPTNV